MKILHLADLHIGKIVLEQSMLEDQKYMLKKIIEKIKEEKIELILISGDVYDRSVPPSEAVTCLSNFLKTLIKDLNLKVCMIAGNHDSKERLGFGSEIFADDGLYISADYNGTIDKVELEDEFGKLNVYMLPYIKPVEVRGYFDGKEINSYNEAVKLIIEKENIDKTVRNIILSHQFVTSGNEEPERSESETLTLGGTENVDISCYKDFDYVALGHIHGPQRIGRDTARYAGTILKYSFSEVNQNKCLTILDFKEKDNIEIDTSIIINPIRDMRVIRGPIEKLISEEVYKNTNREDYIRAIITNEEQVYDAIGKIKKVYPNTLRLDIENSKSEFNQDIQISDLDNIKKKDEVQLFNEFYQFQNNQELNEAQLSIVKQVVKEVKKEDK